MCVALRRLVPAFQQLLRRHQACPYLALLRKHCRTNTHAWRMIRHSNGINFKSGVPSQRKANTQGSFLDKRDLTPLSWAAPLSGVCNFAEAATRYVVPKALLGNSHNWRHFIVMLRHFIRLNLRESFSLHQLTCRMQSGGGVWRLKPMKPMKPREKCFISPKVSEVLCGAPRKCDRRFWQGGCFFC